METIETQDLLLVGSIWRAHGVRGELKVLPEDDPERLLDLETLHLGGSPEDARPREVEQIRLHRMKRGTVLLVKLKGLDDRDEAETYRKVPVYAHEDNLPPLAEGEVYVEDLIGLEVVTEDEEPVGTLKDVLDSPGQDLYVIERAGGGEDAMVPAVDDFIREIDLDAGRLTIRPIEGLLD
jgi:16S rRNA processing protein RimM